MRNLLRNKEVLKTFVIHIVISLIAIFIAGFDDVKLLCFIMVLCVIFTSTYLFSVYKRYKKISELAFDVNRVLHGEEQISFDRYAEGELSILQSEIDKMVIHLRQQHQQLLDDKIYLSDSIADIAHQLRTPLTSINLLLSLLSDENITQEKKQKLTHELYELLSRIDWLITSLLKISKLDAGTVQFKNEAVPLKTLIEKSISPLLVPLELRQQELRISSDGDFFGDISWTCEALTNIIKNCMEHTQDGGTIEIKASENALYSEIVIIDNGAGIAPEDLPHIFERFYKGKNSDEKSFGIGLALARMIISGENGTVKADNNTPSGAKFSIRFYKGTV